MQTLREFAPGDRYQYGFNQCSTTKGYAQIDTSQDASYFGTWANPFDLKIVCYCEGDITVQVAETPEEFVEAIRNIQQWNSDNGHKFLGIDPGLGTQIAQRFTELGLGELLH